MPAAAGSSAVSHPEFTPPLAAVLASWNPAGGREPGLLPSCCCSVEEVIEVQGQKERSCVGIISQKVTVEKLKITLSFDI